MKKILFTLLILSLFSVSFVFADSILQQNCESSGGTWNGSSCTNCPSGWFLCGDVCWRDSENSRNNCPALQEEGSTGGIIDFNDESSAANTEPLINDIGIGGLSQSECSGDGLCNPIGTDSFSELLETIATWIRNIGLALAPLIFVIGGIMFITAAGEPGKVQTAKKLMIYAAIGLIVILLAQSLATTFQGFIG